MFNRKSSYALNKKDPNAIVYMDANEAIIRLTREDFASEEEFLKWKSLSDADYHASEKEDHVYANHTLLLLCAFKNECGFNGSVFTLAVGFQYSGVKVKAPISPHPFSMYGHISGQYIIGGAAFGNHKFCRCHYSDCSVLLL